MGDVSATELKPKHIVHKYGEHDLQTLSAWPLTSSEQSSTTSSIKKYWIIYIHGGAWRDPLISNLSFLPTINVLLNPTNADSTLSQVSGFASIDYRLSAHPNFPQDPATTPETAYRNAKHPDHIDDVLTAIQVLQSTYQFGENYVLVGHSCGATLAFQTLMQLRKPLSAPPAAILGVCGIYDIPLILKNHATSPYYYIYKDFTLGAFGDDETLWKDLSPSCYGAFDDWMKMKGKAVVLASSEDDELVEAEQLDVMDEHLKLGDALTVKRITDLKGAHNSVFSEGVEMAKVVVGGLAELHNAENRT